MKNIFHRYLSLPFEISKPDLFSTIGDINFVHTELPQHKDQNLEKFLNSLGLEIGHCETFITPPGLAIPIHCDSPTFDNHVKINVTWGPEDGKIIWWECQEYYKKEPVFGDHTAIYHSYSTTKIPEGFRGDTGKCIILQADEEKCKKIYEANTNILSLVNVGQLHSTYNPSKTQYRWTLCFVPKYINSNNYYVSWDEAMDVFKDYIVEEK